MNRVAVYWTETDQITELTEHVPEDASWYEPDELETLFRDIEVGLVGKLLVPSLSVLGTTRELVGILADLATRDVVVVAVAGGFDSSTPRGRLTLNVLEALASVGAE